MVAIFEPIDCHDVNSDLGFFVIRTFSIFGLVFLAWAISAIGKYGIFFAAFFFLDSMLPSMPFHSVRAFVPLVIFLVGFLLYLRRKIGFGILLFLSVISALIHFSAWLYVIFVLASLGLTVLTEKKESGKVNQRRKHFWLLITVSVSAGILFYLYIAPSAVMQSKVLPRISVPFTGVAQLIQYGTGLFVFCKLLILTAILSLTINDTRMSEARPLLLMLFVVTFMVTFLSGDSVVFSRLMLLIQPVIYCGFLQKMSMGNNGRLDHLANLSLLSLLFIDFIVNSLY